jgi:hypothetical protein
MLALEGGTCCSCRRIITAVEGSPAAGGRELEAQERRCAPRLSRTWVCTNHSREFLMGLNTSYLCMEIDETMCLQDLLTLVITRQDRGSLRSDAESKRPFDNQRSRTQHRHSLRSLQPTVLIVGPTIGNSTAALRHRPYVAQTLAWCVPMVPASTSARSWLPAPLKRMTHFESAAGVKRAPLLLTLTRKVGQVSGTLCQPEQHPTI